MKGRTERNGLEIAVVGMSGRFPGAGNVRRFWENLENGVHSIRFFTDEELLANSNFDPARIKEPNFVKAMGIIEDVEYFDAFFFGYSPPEAELLDPQLRIFYEVCWETLEDAGCDPSTYSGSIGVYAGGTSNRSWEVLTIISGKQEILGQFNADTLCDKDYLSTRISHKLDLKGPSFTLHSACSTALVGVHLACWGLLTGQCDAALAGGVSVQPENARAGGYLYEEGLIRSLDGFVRAFDAKAKGVVFSHGAAAVLLKRLDDALAGGDHIYAVIKGFSANNDGMAKSSFSAPSVEGQTRAVAAALYMAEVKPETVTYVETHGTGTEIGDPIEIEALKTAFNTDKKQYCAVGSLKTNIGHLDVAAGVASLVKTCLMFVHRQIPPSLNFEKPNPAIDFDNSPFYVNTELREWKGNGYPLRAGVSSFGVGGTNVHLILEEAPAPGPSSKSRPYRLILLSARSKKALEQTTENVVNYLKENPGIDLADAAYTLKTGRKAFEHRKMLVCKDVEEAVAILEPGIREPGKKEVKTYVAREEKRAVFMFPGQGSQYVNMAKGLYESEPVFRKEMDRCFEILNGLLDYDIKEILYPSGEAAKNAKGREGLNVDIHPSIDIDQTGIAQPVIFTVEYALAKLLMAWGIGPYAMTGHSIGEYTAACLAGVFSLEEALFVVSWRGRLMQQMPGGAMLSVPFPEEELQSLLTGARENELSLAAVNGPSQCSVSGPHEAVDAFARQLEERGVQSRKLHTSHAFHSGMMGPILKTFGEKVARVTRNQPQIPFISNVTGTWITFRDAVDPGYWAGHLRRTVRFAHGVTELLKEKNSIFIEAGPGRTLCTLLKQHRSRDENPGPMTVNLVRHPEEEAADEYYLLNQIGQIWLYGKSPDWSGFYAGEKRRRLSLPTYPFQRRYYWIEGNPAMMIREGMAGRSLPGKKPDIADWFYIPSWKHSVISAGAKKETGPGTTHGWLVFADDGEEYGFASRLVKQLGRGNEKEKGVTAVRMGEEFAKREDGSYTVAPGRESDYDALVGELYAAGGGKLPQRIVHAWNLSGRAKETWAPDDADVETYLDRAFYSLLYLVRALGRLDFSHEIQIAVLTDGMQEVWGERVDFPWKAAVLGPVMTIPREYPEIKCRCIDMVLPGPGDGEGVNKEWQRLIQRLLDEFGAGINDTDCLIAYRGNQRLVRTFEPVSFASPGQTPPQLRQGGVYLVTGGLGGIGLVLARRLAETPGVKLILTGRSPFPAPEEWGEYLRTHGGPDPVAQKIRKVKELEQAGAQVWVYRVDVADSEGMRGVVEEVRERFGTINGVIHSAGVPGGGLIQLKTRQMADSVLAPKIKGTLVLHRALRGMEPDFVIFCSSVASMVPGPGQVDYCAANAFLDVFALYKSHKEPCFYTSVNWDAWREVGMAVEAAKQFAGGRAGTFTPREIDHPLFDYYTTGTPRGGMEKNVYTTYFSMDRHWVLSEHRSREGRGIVPGVTYLEMAYAALQNRAQEKNSGGIVEIRDVLFMTPLILEEGEERETQMIFNQGGEGFGFRVRSRIKGGEDDWENHAKGEAAFVPVQPGEPETYDLEAIERECSAGEIDAASQWAPDAENSLLIFGPRWGNLKKVKAGKNQGLALLELPEAFISDLDRYTLHPAVLDLAAAFLLDCIDGGKPYIPYSYKKLRIRRAFPARIYSYGRLKGDGQTPGGFLKFDITLMDEEGRVLVEIDEFAMLEISQGILELLKDKEHGAGSAPEPAGLPDPLEMGLPGEEPVEDGISPAEGVEVFTRILAEGLPWVAVSTRDLGARIRAGQGSGALDAAAGLEGAAAPGPVYSRPDISSEYAAPGTHAEQTLAAIWQELLGIDRVGVNDDFFELGGDSLKAAMMITKIKQKFNLDISVREIFNSPRVKDLAGHLAGVEDSGAVSVYTSIPAVEEKEYYPLSLMQRRLYILNRMEGIGTAYNQPFALVIEGEPDRQRLERAFRLLIRRHESFRTSFHMVNEEPVQVIHETEEVDFQIGYSHWEEGEEGIKDLVRGFVRAFDLSEAPLLRVNFVTLPGGKYAAIFDVHHIVCDGASYMIAVKGFDALYGGEELPGLRTRYRDFSGWQHSVPGRAAVKKQEAFWLDAFTREIPVLDLPLDYPRPRIQVFEGNTLRFSIRGEGVRRLKALALAENASLYMVLLGIFYVFLAKLGACEDIVVGSPAVGRKHPDIEQVTGMFANTLAHRNYPVGEKTFQYFLKEVKEQTLGALENQEYPFEVLVEKVSARRDASRNPVFDVMFDLQNQLEQSDIESGNLVEYDGGMSKFDLTLTVIEDRESLLFAFEYCTRLFKPGTIEKYGGYFKRALSFLVENPVAALCEVDILSPEEKRNVLYDFNDTGVDYPRNKTVHELFAEQAVETPDAVSVVGSWQLAVGRGEKTGEVVQVTYRELNRKADQAAQALKEKGVLADDIVAIMMERSIEMIIGIFGILKAGSAYLPIEPEYPEERIDYMVKDSGAKVLLTNLPEGRDLHHSSLIIHHSGSLAYVLYTSGTTGKPKGVMVEHRNVAAYLHHLHKEFAIDSTDRMIQLFSYSFDAFVEEIFSVLLKGGYLVVPDASRKMDIDLLSRLMVNHRVSIVPCTPLMLNEFNKLYGSANPTPAYPVHNPLRYVHTFLCGGDVLKEGHIDNLLGIGKIYNAYGPTETTVCATYYRYTVPVKNRPAMFSSIPIGTPISNYRVYILDRNRYPVPIGVSGEISISGAGVARGYLNQPELTGEKFVDYRSYRSYRTYRSYQTGDLARWLPDGNIEFLGRIDLQVKIRGFRIEPGEIEKQLLGHGDIKEAVVLEKEDQDGNKYLCACIVPAGAAGLAVSGLRDYLSGKLPGYMIPAYFVKVDKIPLTSSGKIDLKVLERLGGEPLGTGVRYAPARDRTESTLVRIWERFLGTREIGIHDDFFLLGGDSLKAITLIARIQKETHVRVPLPEFFRTPTVAGLAGYIKNAAPQHFLPVKAVEKKEYYSLSSGQKRLYTWQQIAPESTAYNLPQVAKLEQVDIKKLEQAFIKSLERHEGFRTSFPVKEHEPVQRVHDRVEFEIEYHGELTLQYNEIIRDFIRGFDLSQAPLLRVGVIKPPAGSTAPYILMADMHHIISDGISQELLIRDFMKLYAGERLPRMRFQYKDYCEWLNNEKQKGRIEKQESYWLEEFAGGVPLLRLPFDFDNPGDRRFEGNSFAFEIGPGETKALKEMLRAKGVTLSTALLAIYYVLLAKYSGQEDIVVGIAAAGRTHADLQNIVGMFVNMLPARNRPGENKTFAAFLKEVDENVLKTYENQDYPYEALIKKLKLQRVPGRDPLIAAAFTAQDFGMADGLESAAGDGGLTVSPYDDESRQANFPLDLEFVENNGAINLRLRYFVNLFKESTVRIVTRHYLEVLGQVLENRNTLLKDIKISYFLPSSKRDILQGDGKDFAF